MIKLYGSPASRGLRNMGALEELGLPYEIVRVIPKNGDHKTPEFLAINPAGKVPALVDGEGRFPEGPAGAGFRYFLLPSARRQLRNEARAQFAAFRETGLPLDHVNVHNHMQLHPTILGLILAGRILGMGDVVSLVEKAAESIQQEDAERMAAKLAKGQFDMEDLRGQLAQMRRMGGLGALAGMIPGMKKAQGALAQAQGFAKVPRFRADHLLALRRDDAQALRADRFHVRSPAVDEDHVVPGGGEAATESMDRLDRAAVSHGGQVGGDDVQEAQRALPPVRTPA